MKKTFQFRVMTALMVLTILSFSACQKDNDEDESTNSYSFDGQEFKANWAAFSYTALTDLYQIGLCSTTPSSKLYKEANYLVITIHATLLDLVNDLNENTIAGKSLFGTLNYNNQIYYFSKEGLGDLTGNDNRIKIRKEAGNKFNIELELSLDNKKLKAGFKGIIREVDSEILILP